MLAALQAIQQTAPFIFTIADVSMEEFDPSRKADWVIWLSDRKPEVRDWPMIAYNHTEITNDRIVFEQVTPTYWRLNARLNEGIALNAHLLIRLSEILLPVGKFSESVEANDRRVLPEQAAWSVTGQVSERKATSVPGNQNVYWMVLIILTLISERLLALKRNQ